MSLEININPDELFRAALIQACHDALAAVKLDKDGCDHNAAKRAEAREWLMSVGALLAEKLNIASAEKVRAWAASPSAPDGLSINELMTHTGLPKGTITLAITRGELPAYRNVFQHSQAYSIPTDEARNWIKRHTLREAPHEQQQD